MADLPADLAPHVVSNLKDVFNTEIVVFENKAEQRFMNDHVGEKHFEFIWNVATPALLASIRAFFNSKGGQFRSWTINDFRIGSGDVTVRFTVDELDITPIKFKAFNVKARIKTCST